MVHAGEKTPSVAIVGGGISGLVCANRLLQLGLRPAVFDTGKRACGGRCSSRQIEAGGSLHTCDHSAQFFTVSDPRFELVVRSWLQKGVCKEWRARVGTVSGDVKKGISFINQAELRPYIGVQGMSSLVEDLCLKVDVNRPVWVSKVEWERGAWQLYDGHKSLGGFTYLVIAHNGKCADRLMSPAGVPRIHRLLKAKFGAKLRSSTQDVMQLNSLFVLMVVLTRSSSPLATWDGAKVQVKGMDELQWCANNTSKYGQQKKAHARENASSHLECWTLVSTPEFGQKHKCPQENMPPKKEAEVTQLMLHAFAKLLNLPPDPFIRRCIFTRLQLWGAAVPLNGLANGVGSEFAFESEMLTGICGDWLGVAPRSADSAGAGAGVGLQAAAVSGYALAEHLARHAAYDASAGDVGLHGRFAQPKAHAGIGSFPPGRRVVAGVEQVAASRKPQEPKRAAAPAAASSMPANQSQTMGKAAPASAGAAVLAKYSASAKARGLGHDVRRRGGSSSSADARAADSGGDVSDLADRLASATVVPAGPPHVLPKTAVPKITAKSKSRSRRKKANNKTGEEGAKRDKHVQEQQEVDFTMRL